MQAPSGARSIFSRALQSVFSHSVGKEHVVKEHGPFPVKSLKRGKEALGHCILVQ